MGVTLMDGTLILHLLISLCWFGKILLSYSLPFFLILDFMWEMVCLLDFGWIYGGGIFTYPKCFLDYSDYPKIRRLGYQRVFHVLLGHIWNLVFSRDLYDWEVDMVANLMLFLKDVFLYDFFQDQKIWTLNSSGLFSLRSMFSSF